MPRFNRMQRERFRNQRAAEAARARKQADPFEQARARCRELRLPPSCALLVDALAERHRELGAGVADQPVYIGYGDGTEAERRSRNRKPVQRPRHPGRLPPLTELTGRSRRTMIRAAKLIDEHQVVSRGRAGQLVERPYRCKTSGHVLMHAVGVGGCDLGGLGLANAYWPAGITPPELAPAPASTSSAGRPAERPRRFAQLLEDVRREQPRGP